VLAVPALTGDEPAILASMAARRTAAVPLPLDDLAGSNGGQTTSPFAVVGQPGSSGAAVAVSASVLSVAVSAREAEAARVLLAREEGLIVSPIGATAVAALVRAVRAGRARRPRERRLPRDLSAVVVLTGDPLGSSGSPPLAADAIPGRAVTLAEIMANPQRLLIEPPGNGG
jgi:threonine synthase